MLLVAYIAVPHPNRLCERDGCGDDAHFTAVCANGDIVEHLCGDHTAEHMRGNAYALAGPDSGSFVTEARMMSELDRFPLAPPED